MTFPSSDSLLRWAQRISGCCGIFRLVGCRYGKRKRLGRGVGLESLSKPSRGLSHVDISSDPGCFERFRVRFPLLPTAMSQHLWLRCEKKEFERRAALSPKIAKALIDAGFTIHVERDEQRIFDDSEYESYAQPTLTIELR